MDGQNFENEQNVTPEVTPVVEAAPEKKTDALAIVSLVLGILSIVLVCCTAYIAILPAIGGIVCAVISKKNNGKSGLATAGMICSIVGIVLAVIYTIIGIAGLAMLGDIDVNSLY